MNVAIILEKFSHVKSMGEYFKTNVKNNKFNDFLGYVYEKSNKYFFVHSIGCMHTLNIMHCLHTKYSVDTFVRIGSCGFNEKCNLSLGEVVLVDKANNLDAISKYHLSGANPSASKKLKKLFVEKLNLNIKNCFTIDVIWQIAPCEEAVVDMETSALYAYADDRKIDAISLSIARDDENSRISVQKQAELIRDLCIEVISILENQNK